MTSEEEILARKAKYNRVETETDALGRTIGVKRLTPSQQLAVQEMAPGLEGTTAVVDDEGKTFEVPKSSPLIIAASVRRINDDDFGFPRNRSDLNALLDRLDTEGLDAAARAIAKLSAPKDGGLPVDGKELAKN